MCIRDRSRGGPYYVFCGRGGRRNYLYLFYPLSSPIRRISVLSICHVDSCSTVVELVDSVIPEVASEVLVERALVFTAVLDVEDIVTDKADVDIF